MLFLPTSLHHGKNDACLLLPSRRHIDSRCRIIIIIIIIIDTLCLCIAFSTLKWHTCEHLACVEQFFRGIKCDFLLAKRAWKQIQVEDKIEMQKRKREAVIRAFEDDEANVDMNKVRDV
jgi:hypothetical protein